MIKRINFMELENKKGQCLQIYKPDGSSNNDKYPFVMDVNGDGLFEFNAEDISKIIEMLKEFEEFHA